MSAASFNPRLWLQGHGEVAVPGCAPPKPPNLPSGGSEDDPSLGELGGLGGARLPAATSHTAAEHTIDLLARRVRVSIQSRGGDVVGVAMVTQDDARRRLVEAVDARLRDGVGLAMQAVELAAYAELIAELRRLELEGVVA